LNLDHPAPPIPPPRPVDPAGAVDHAQFAWPTAPWTALTTRRPQAPQALRQALAQEGLQEGRTATTEGGNINVQIGGKLGVLLTSAPSIAGSSGTTPPESPLPGTIGSDPRTDHHFLNPHGPLHGGAWEEHEAPPSSEEGRDYPPARKRPNRLLQPPDKSFATYTRTLSA